MQFLLCQPGVSLYVRLTLYMTRNLKIITLAVAYCSLRLCCQVNVMSNPKRHAVEAADCLTLNIWTPSPDREAKLPVLVYICGGGFLAGDGSNPNYLSHHLAAKGLVAVTINYRVGCKLCLLPSTPTRKSTLHCNTAYWHAGHSPCCDQNHQDHQNSF